MVCNKKLGTSIFLGIVSYGIFPIAIAVTLASCILFTLFNLDTISKVTFRIEIALLVILVLIFIYSCIASCTCYKCCKGERVMKLIQAICYTVAAILLIAVGAYTVSINEKISDLIQIVIDESNNRTEVIDAIDYILKHAGCENLEFEECKNMIDDYMSPFFLYLGGAIMILGIIILIGAVVGYWFAFSENYAKVENKEEEDDESAPNGP